MPPKVLIVLSSHNKIDAIDKPTGWYLPEFAHPWYKLQEHCDITVASPAGGEAPLDPSSVDASKDDKISQDFLKNQSSLWKNTEKLESFKGKAKDFDAIFYVGGHGPMFDLAVSKVSQDLILEFADAGKLVSAVCHGPAVFANVKRSNGDYFIAGQKVTGFTNTEEDQVGLTQAMPFSLEDALTKAIGSSGQFEKAAEPWGEKVVVSGKDGKLITGQNPISASGVGEALLKALGN